MNDQQRQVAHAVKDALEAGLSIIWPREDGTKRPEGSWADAQEKPRSRDQLLSGFREKDRNGLMVVCGKVSGNLEVLDFENAEIYATFQAAMSLAGEEELLERIEAGYQERCPRGGYHLPYRCEVVGGNRKLAFDEMNETLIETRGEGGCFMAAPSCFNGSAWTRMKGSFSSIAEVTIEERDTLFRIAQLQCRAPKVAEIPVFEPRSGPERDDRPGDDFNRRGNWDFLTEAGWEMVGGIGEQQYWLRPGKAKGQGHSAVLHLDSQLFVPFSTSTPFPQTEMGYSKYRTYTYVVHGGDFSAASRELRRLDFGAPRDQATVTVMTEEGEKPPSLLFRTATQIGEAVPEEVPWMCRPFFALGAITEIDGKAKKGGKTTFVLAAVKSVLTGGAFLDEAVIRSPVVLLSEQNDTSLRESLERADLIRHQDLHVAQWAANRGFQWEAAVADARKLCREVGAKMLVIDTFPQWAGIRGESENQSGPMLRAMEPLQVAAMADGLAVAVLRHDRKAGGEVGDSARGSSAIGGTVDIIIQIQRTGGRQQAMSFLSRFDETPETLTVLLREDGTYKALGESDEVRMSGLERQVLEALADAPADEPQATVDLALLCGSDREILGRVLKRLMSKGRVMRVGEGRKGDPFRWRLWPSE